MNNFRPDPSLAEIMNQFAASKQMDKIRRRIRAEKIKLALQMVLILGLMLVLADAFGFILWVMSGQHPIGNFYLGTLTAHLVRFFL